MEKAVIITNQLFKKVKLHHLLHKVRDPKSYCQKGLGKFKAPMMLLDLLPLLPFFSFTLMPYVEKDIVLPMKLI